ncbi:hypothetical protein [Curtobacterium sp. NPDC089689]|uniref:hypothetical protein n=1 Tax=Curtobacterium sp. NPDC089689 TaxID=3363968 RepID=UPI0037FC422A
MPTTPITSATVRRSTAKGLRTRARIVDAAAELMLTRGVAGTTLDDIVLLPVSGGRSCTTTPRARTRSSTTSSTGRRTRS